MAEIIGKLKLSAKHKCQNVAYDSIGQVTYNNQGKRQPNILGIEYLAEFAVQISYVHQKQCIKSQKAAKENIIQQAAEESDQEPFPFSAHEAERRRQYDHQVGDNARKCKAVKNTALEDKKQDDQYG